MSYFDEKQERLKFESNLALKEEFEGDIESYLAYRKALLNGQIKVMGTKKKEN